ncbi:MAG: RHS repeat-associated core domain-containing protein, partial [Terriglobales bacterium]
ADALGAQQSVWQANTLTQFDFDSFTGKPRDNSTGFDYFGARYYGSALGRFLTPDPAGLAAVDPANPQSWNRYAYALSNPASRIDPTGLDSIGICRPVAKLHVDFGDRSNAEADGPYDPSFESGAAADDTGYSGCASLTTNPFNIFTVDGLTMDGGLASELGGLGTGGPESGGSEASSITISSTVIPANVFVPGPHGDPVPYGPSMTSAGNVCSTVVGSGSTVCTAYLTPGWSPVAVAGAGAAVVAIGSFGGRAGEAFSGTHAVGPGNFTWPPAPTSACSVYPAGGPLSFVCTGARNGPIADSIRGCLITAYTPGFGYAPGLFSGAAPGLPGLPGLDSSFGLTAHAFCIPLGVVYH